MIAYDARITSLLLICAGAAQEALRSQTGIQTCLLERQHTLDQSYGFEIYWFAATHCQLLDWGSGQYQFWRPNRSGCRLRIVVLPTQSNTSDKGTLLVNILILLGMLFLGSRVLWHHCLRACHRMIFLCVIAVEGELHLQRFHFCEPHIVCL